MVEPLTPEQKLRIHLGEQIPEGGEDKDTMFSDQEIAFFLEEGFGDPKAAAYHGWLAKMANFTNLVNVSEGNAARELGELHKSAQRMVDRYSGYATTPSRGRARIGYISRTEE
mgnify:CR=1 FL=1